MTVRVLWPFPTVPWVGLQFVIMVFSDHAHLQFVQCIITGKQTKSNQLAAMKLRKGFFNRRQLELLETPSWATIGLLNSQ